MQARCRHALRPALSTGSSCRTNSHPSWKKRKEAATMDAGTTHKLSTAQRSCWPQPRGQGTQNAKNETAAPTSLLTSSHQQGVTSYGQRDA